LASQNILKLDYLSGFETVTILFWPLKTGQTGLVFKWHSKTGAFHFQTQNHLSNTGMVWILDVRSTSLL
jgi:hypothetical protein